MRSLLVLAVCVCALSLSRCATIDTVTDDPAIGTAWESAQGLSPSEREKQRQKFELELHQQLHQPSTTTSHPQHLVDQAHEPLLTKRRKANPLGNYLDQAREIYNNGVSSSTKRPVRVSG